MLNRVTFIFAAVFGLALSILAGCSKTYGPELGAGDPIRFEPGSLLLNKDASTRATLTSAFATDSTFAIFGESVISGNKSTVFGGTNGVTVTAGGSPLRWAYSPARYWYWESTGDWYDFAAVSPAGKGTVKMDIPGNLAVSTHFDIASDNYDLLGAALRRRGNILNPSDTVRLRFAHLTSAVGLRILNNSETKSVTVDSVRFKNLVVVGDAKIAIDLSGNPEMSWINTERNGSFVRVSKPATALAAGGTADLPFDLMVPQRLDQAVGAGGLEENMPKLFLYYTPSGSTQKVAEISLKDICPRNSDTPITSWVKGTKYIYEISMRLDGGVLVRITTTDWGDPIEAETPGLLI